ncbi:MAG: hypothetical protein A2Y17_00905 [Clostridiales bacterium GWF2_38_85]|nr:MAG: hypothetical protein A2Y17_00905 [Clostridiales bacterium GWF2_38_85]HBL84548.1 hypothetical protein [Clostridiales bacterium]
MNNESIICAVEFIRENLKAQLTIEDIANHVGYSVYHFSREFYKVMDCTVMQFIRNEKIKEASNEILNHKNILECALSYGFDTHAGFTNAFYSVLGCNPKDYCKHELRSKNYIRSEINMENINVIIRLINMNDISDMWENVFSRNTPQEIKERIQHDLDGYEKKTGFHVVAEVNGKVVGTLGLGRYNEYSIFSNLGDFVIHPDYQGNGLARKLLQNTIEIAREFNIDTLMIQARIDNEVVIKKYISLGFSKVFESDQLVYLMMNI